MRVMDYAVASVRRRNCGKARWIGAAISLALASGALAQDLASEVQRLVASSKLNRARVGISVVDAENGSVLAAFHADEGFIPASNMKLLTSGAAFLVLGPNYSFKTELIRNGDRLILRGSGDPALADPDILKEMRPAINVEDVLGRLVGATQKAGVSSVSEIIIDDRVFDREYVHPAWSPNHLGQGYGAQVCGLNFHRNVLLAFPKANPQGPGTPPVLSELEPACSALTILNRAQTVAENRSTLWLSRAAESNAFTLFGEVGPRISPSIEVPLHSNGEFFGRVIADRLQAAGASIARDGDAPRVRLATKDEDLEGGTVVAMITTPIEEVLDRCNTHSENLYAESLMKAMGHAITGEPGSWNNGTAVLRMMISEKISAEAAATTTISDGSGLSRQNVVSPQTFTKWLTVMSSAPGNTIFVQSLATPGKPGTLEKRFRTVQLGNELRAKSGFINGVRTLSGYITHPQTGRRLAFSVMVNDITGDDNRAALELHESVVKAADEWLTRKCAAEKPKIGG